jgi:ATP-dependent Clp protease protease subunit
LLTGVVLGECSSSALLLFAGCRRRLVTAQSTLLFHKMRWQSDKRMHSVEAALWARHFDELEREIDDLQVKLFGAAEEKVREWTLGGHFVTGPQLVAAGLAEMLEL